VNFVLATLLLACSDPSSSADSDSPDVTPVTYDEHIRPIVERSCLGCHVDQGTAPFALDTYAQLFTVRELARQKVSTRTMPPWFTSGRRELRGRHPLGDDGIALFGAWWIRARERPGRNHPTRRRPTTSGSVASACEMAGCTSDLYRRGPLLTPVADPE
jgi:hypothetical protein